ncbi:homeobox-leucine zipper protein ATHB-15 [Cinnamomum micranthum f. kanehirae]|uniref:Homeobox-leucine zipper protein ATHB-15 n=1 Tax=Cinnamomum micranthum f. kanehirae TaxID=337451 RepID=A0A3S3LXX1_9MAGN|nr:homeobox-leucine zipper protein ATHB-15 [Cinnamomum micranthum f. kanehirae]
MTWHLIFPKYPPPQQARSAIRNQGNIVNTTQTKGGGAESEFLIERSLVRTKSANRLLLLIVVFVWLKGSVVGSEATDRDRNRNRNRNPILGVESSGSSVSVKAQGRDREEDREISRKRKIFEGMMAVSPSKEAKLGMDPGKYVRYTPEQVEALEKLYHDCPKPSSIRRHQLIRECPILSHIEPKQIKVWFQNRRCREKQRKEASRLQAVNRKLTAMNKLLMEENDRLQKQVSQLVSENGYFRQKTQNTALATADTSCESVVTSGQHHLTPQHPPRDATPAGLFSIAEETLTEFLSKATGTAVEWVQMPGMKLSKWAAALLSCKLPLISAAGMCPGNSISDSVFFFFFSNPDI